MHVVHLNNYDGKFSAMCMSDHDNALHDYNTDAEIFEFACQQSAGTDVKKTNFWACKLYMLCGTHNARALYI